MKARNLLIIMSDQHNREMMGCYGHPVVQTPNLDRLAAQGTRFTACWTPSPVHSSAGVLRDRKVHPPDWILGQR
jgi:arylsulfatase A-like enzyme